MDARYLRAALAAAALSLLGASYRTENFIVTAPSESLAREIGDAAESYRQALAIEWLGKELPPWGEPCPITAQVSPGLGAGGATSFMFHHRRPSGWTMSIQGSRERILDSVLPHEVTHTIFATHFGRPLPRWADEGACTTVEHSSEKSKQERLLYQFLTSQRGIAFNQMFAMREYPADILPLYAQGYSVARYLIAQGGKRKFIEYVGDGLDSGNWTAATQQHYGYRSLSELQVTWLEWVRGGMSREPVSPLGAAQAIAANNAREAQPPAKVAMGATSVADEPRTYPVPPRDASLASVQPGRSSAQPFAPAASASDPAVLAANGETRVVSGSQYGRQGGWYARQREAGRASLPDRESQLAQSERGRVAPAGGATIAAGSESEPFRSATRVGPPQQPQPTVLEWSSQPGQAIPAFPPLALPPSATGSVWR